MSDLDLQLNEEQQKTVQIMIDQGKSALEVSNYLDLQGIPPTSAVYNKVIQEVPVRTEQVSELVHSEAGYTVDRGDGVIERYSRDTGFTRKKDGVTIEQRDPKIPAGAAASGLKRIPPTTPGDKDFIPGFNPATDYAYQHIINMANAGFSALEIYQFAKEHPDAYRGAAASYLVDKTASKITTKLAGKSGGELFKEQQIMGIYEPDDKFAGTDKDGHILVIKDKDYKALPDNYREIFDNEGYAAMMAAWNKDTEDFKANNTKLKDDYWMPNSSVEKVQNESPELYDVLMNEGYDAYIAKVNQNQKNFESNNVQLGDGTWVDKNSYNNFSQAQKDYLLANGVDAFNDKYSSAKTVVTPKTTSLMVEVDTIRPEFETYLRNELKDKGYSNVEIQNFIQYGFHKDKWYNVSPAGGSDELRKDARTIELNYEDKYKLKDVTVKTQGLLANVPIIGLMPAPGGDPVTSSIAIVAALVALGYGAYQATNMAKQAYEDYKERTGAEITTSDIMVANPQTGETIPLSSVAKIQALTPAEQNAFKVKEGFNQLTPAERKAFEVKEGFSYLTPAEQNAFKQSEGFSKLSPAEQEAFQKKEGFALNPPMGEEIGQGSVNWREPVVFIPGPGRGTPIPERLITDKSTLTERNGILMAAYEVAQRKKALVDTLPKIEGVDWDALTKKATEVNQERLAKAWRQVETAIENGNQRAEILKLYRVYQKAVSDYDSAMTGYISRTTYTPVAGTISPVLIQRIVKQQLLSSSKNTKLTNTQIQDIIQVIDEAFTNNLTRQQIKQIAQTQTQIQTKTKTQTKTKLALQTAAATRTKTATKVADVEATREAVQEAAQTAEATTSGTATTTKIKLPEEDEEKGLKKKRYPPGTVAWKQGIGWWVIEPPYSKTSDRSFVVNKPEGAVITSGISKAIATIQHYGGTPPRALKMDMGIMDVDISKPPRRPSPGAGRQSIKFKRDTAGTYGALRPKAARGKKAGPYYVKGGMVSRKPIG